MTKNNTMKHTEKEWSEAFSRTAKYQFHISGRVMRHIRAAYLDKCKGLSFEESRHLLIHDCKKKLVAIEQIYRVSVITIASFVLKYPTSIVKADCILNGLKSSDMITLKGCVGKIGYYNAIINYLERITENNFMKIITMDIFPEEPKDQP